MPEVKVGDIPPERHLHIKNLAHALWQVEENCFVIAY